MNLTHKQHELLRVITGGTATTGGIDLDEILDAIRYDTTKASLHFSLRALIAHGLIVKKGIEKRRGHQRQVIVSTELAEIVLRRSTKRVAPTVAQTIIEGEPDLELDEV